MSTQSSKSRPTVVLSAAVAALGMGVTVFLVASESESELAVAPTVDVPAQAQRVAPPRPRNAEPIPALVEATPPPTPANSKAKRMARDLEREQIWAALGKAHGLQPAAPGSAAPSESAASLLPTLHEDYIHEAIKEQLVPIALECYNSARREDPELSGKLIMNFTIVGSEDIGGIVEESTIGEESTLVSPFVQDCLRESMYTVTFDPPPDGGRIEVSYPLIFEPDDERE